MSSMNNDTLYTHILLCESLCFSEGKTRPSKKTETFKFISSLALILNGNATCTAVSIDKMKRIVYIARNDPISTTDQRYFDRLFRLIRTYAYLSCGNHLEKAVEDIYEVIRSSMIEYNAKKILKRLLDRKSRAIDQLKAMSQCQNNEKDLFIKELRSNRSIYTQQPSTTEKFYLMKDNLTEEQYVDFLLNTVKKFLIARDELIDNQPNPTDKQFKGTISYALVLYQSRLFQQMLNPLNLTDADGTIYLEKITAHHRSLSLIIKCLARRKNDLGEIYSNITWQIVPTVAREQKLIITPKDAFDLIFTDVYSSMNNTESNSLSLISSKSVYDQHCRSLKAFDDKPSQSVHVHVEILLIDYLLEKNINAPIESNEPEIGISKLPCFLCSIYIDLLNKNYHRCLSLPNCSNGKIDPKWSLRQSEDPAIVKSINEKVLEKVKQSIKKICLDSERSGTKRSGDSDVMATSLEEDAFDEKEFMETKLLYD